MSIAIRLCDETGQPHVSHWLEWKCDSELRYTRPHYTTSKTDQLQQKWFRNGCDTTGAICITQHEWRDVPVVIVPPPTIPTPVSEG